MGSGRAPGLVTALEPVQVQVTAWGQAQVRALAPGRVPGSAQEPVAAWVPVLG